MIEKWLNQVADWIFVLRDRLHRVRRNVAADSDARVRSVNIPSIDGLRKSAQKALSHPALRDRRTQVGIAAGVVLLVCAVIFVGHVSAPRPTASYLWYFDLNTGKLVIAADQIPPIKVPSGDIDGQPAGVRAHLFSCGACSDGTQRFIGYLASYPPEIQKVLANPYGYHGVGDNPQRGHFIVREAKGTKWFAADSDEGEKIIVGAQAKCPQGTPPKSCDDPYGG
ncbi:MAG: hypothetical protein NTW19_16020 [Planctomycetota bacterium]|nr:hypothetical protein [Planctomycetota bacterium]